LAPLDDRGAAPGVGSKLIATVRIAGDVVSVESVARETMCINPRGTGRSRTVK
jgi:hypothetical protein